MTRCLLKPYLSVFTIIFLIIVQSNPSGRGLSETDVATEMVSFCIKMKVTPFLKKSYGGKKHRVCKDCVWLHTNRGLKESCGNGWWRPYVVGVCLPYSQSSSKEQEKGSSGGDGGKASSEEWNSSWTSLTNGGFKGLFEQVWMEQSQRGDLADRVFS